MSAAISVRGVTKRFRIDHDHTDSIKSALLNVGRRHSEEFAALDDVTFDVDEGSVFGLVGANGSGKSTLLKCMARILAPDAGSIEVRGRLAALLELGTGFHPELTGRENVFLNASILGMPRREINRRFDEIVGWAELERFIDNPIKTYSSGMVVRLGFAVATTVEPDVLLVDEVLAVGDMNFRRKSTDRMQSLMASGATIVLVAHDLNTVRNLCDTGASLEHGAVRTHGPIDGVLDDYRERMSYLAAVAAGFPADGPPDDGTIRKVAMTDADNSPTDEFDMDDGFRLVTTIDTERLTGPVFVAATLRSFEGALVAFVASPDTEPVMPGSDLVDVEMAIDDPRLGSGVYSWTVAVRTAAERQLIDRREGIQPFSIRDTRPNQPYAGPLVLQPGWHHRRTDR